MDGSYTQSQLLYALTDAARRADSTERLSETLETPLSESRLTASRLQRHAALRKSTRHYARPAARVQYGAVLGIDRLEYISGILILLIKYMLVKTLVNKIIENITLKKSIG